MERIMCWRITTMSAFCFFFLRFTEEEKHREKRNNTIFLTGKMSLLIREKKRNDLFTHLRRWKAYTRGKTFWKKKICISHYINVIRVRWQNEFWRCLLRIVRPTRTIYTRNGRLEYATGDHHPGGTLTKKTWNYYIKPFIFSSTSYYTMIRRNPWGWIINIEIYSCSQTLRNGLYYAARNTILKWNVQ